MISMSREQQTGFVMSGPVVMGDIHWPIPWDLAEGASLLCIVVFETKCNLCSRSDNQICEEFFQKLKAHIVKGGLKSLSTMMHETFKFIKFHSEHDSKELQIHMELEITRTMWSCIQWL